MKIGGKEVKSISLHDKNGELIHEFKLGPSTDFFKFDAGKPTEVNRFDNVSWLENIGYRRADIFERYEFLFRMGDYAAWNMFTFDEVERMPLEFFKDMHDGFIERAERREKF
jgi:hypothetical protein